MRDAVPQDSWPEVTGRFDDSWYNQFADPMLDSGIDDDRWVPTEADSFPHPDEEDGPFLEEV